VNGRVGFWRGPRITVDQTRMPTPADDAYAALAEQIDRVRSLTTFFVVGCQKSGTTWVRNLLGGHPAIAIRSETLIGDLLLTGLAAGAQHFNRHTRGKGVGLTNEHAQHLYTTAASLLMADWVGDDPAIEAVGEKTPEHALVLPRLRAAFPGAKVIHIIRDGRDVCVSGWFHNQRKAKADFATKFPTLSHYVAYTAPHHWVRYIEQARAFGEQHPGDYFELRYEDLHGRGAEVVGEMLDFIGVDASGDAVAACREAGAFDGKSEGRGQGEEDRGSFYRKGVVGDWENHFDARAEQVFMQHAGDLLRDLGYAEPARAAG